MAATAREPLETALTRVADDLIALREAVDKIDHGQNALLANGESLSGQIESLSGLIAHMIEVLTPERLEQEGPSIADLLARILTQQSGMILLLRETHAILARLDPAARVAPDAAPANGAGHA
ncbi:MAG TPA: hypothetical protein VGG79_04375 [Roseiarcus sp.]|jgi:hypothetical protein